MDPVAENSTNTLVGGGKVADDDIPKDGTGSFPLEWRCPCLVLETDSNQEL